MNICIFPGSFNPIHFGHLNMADFALEKYKFDKIIFIPAHIPPHKNLDKNLSNHRLNMVRLAVSGNKNYEVSDIEYKSDNKSYSLVTVKKLIDLYKLNAPLNFIIGTDAFEKIESWYKADELKKLVRFIVFPRNGQKEKSIYNNLKSKGWDFEIVDFTPVDISSTEIREFKNKNLTDKKVEEYIENNGLYQH